MNKNNIHKNNSNNKKIKIKVYNSTVKLLNIKNENENKLIKANSKY